MPFLPVGIKPGILFGILLAAGAAAQGDAEDHFLRVGTAVSIIIAVAIAASNVGGKFRKVLDFMEESKKDRQDIHATLEKATTADGQFRESVKTDLALIKQRVSALPCNPPQPECPAQKD